MVRFKQRYLLCEVEFGDARAAARLSAALTTGDVAVAVRAALLDAVGEAGCAAVLPSFSVKYWCRDTGTAILRCARDAHPALWAAVVLVRQLRATPCALRVLHVAGTIRTCQRAAVEHAREHLRRTALLRCRTAARLGAAAAVDAAALDAQIVAALARIAAELGDALGAAEA